MPVDADEVAAKSIARFNVPGRQQPRMGDGSTRGDNEGTVKPRIAKQGYIRFLTLRDLDGRSRAVAKCNQLRAALEADLGGSANLTTGQSQLCQRAALIGVQLEDFEVRWTLGEPIEFTDYMTGVNVQRRVLATLGLERRARDVGSSPSLSEYLRERAAAPDADVVVAVNGTQAEPAIEAGLELAPEGASSGPVEPVGESEAPAGRVPASSPESRTGDAPQSQPDAFVEASTAAAKPGNGAAS
jgi:hypothetical protein